jgi:hypothetical protein
MIRRSRWRAAACSIIRTAIGSTPATALDDDRRGLDRLERGQALAEEVGRARRVDEVDARLPRVRCSTLELSECCMRRSSASKSLTVVPRSSVRARRSRPRREQASARLVLPAAAGPTSASVRIDSTPALGAGGGLGMRLSPSAGAGAWPAGGGWAAMPDYGRARGPGCPLSHKGVGRLL